MSQDAVTQKAAHVEEDGRAAINSAKGEVFKKAVVLTNDAFQPLSTVVEDGSRKLLVSDPVCRRLLEEILACQQEILAWQQGR
jgi:hypothetical protein